MFFVLIVFSVFPEISESAKKEMKETKKCFSILTQPIPPQRFLVRFEQKSLYSCYLTFTPMPTFWRVVNSSNHFCSHEG